MFDRFCQIGMFSCRLITMSSWGLSFHLMPEKFILELSMFITHISIELKLNTKACKFSKCSEYKISFKRYLKRFWNIGVSLLKFLYNIEFLIGFFYFIIQCIDVKIVFVTFLIFTLLSIKASLSSSSNLPYPMH